MLLSLSCGKDTESCHCRVGKIHIKLSLSCGKDTQSCHCHGGKIHKVQNLIYLTFIFYKCIFCIIGEIHRGQKQYLHKQLFFVFPLINFGHHFCHKLTSSHIKAIFMKIYHQYFRFNNQNYSTTDHCIVIQLYNVQHHIRYIFEELSMIFILNQILQKLAKRKTFQMMYLYHFSKIIICLILREVCCWNDGRPDHGGN